MLLPGFETQRMPVNVRRLLCAAQEYLRCFRDPATIHATCENYRAAVTIDLQHDRADRTGMLHVRCGHSEASEGFVGQRYDVPAAVVVKESVSFRPLIGS